MADFTINIQGQNVGEEIELGQNVTQGQLLYLGTNNRWYLTNATVKAKSTTELRIALEDGITGELINSLALGYYDGFTGLVSGTKYYLSASVGAITSTVYNNTTNIIRYVGTATSSTELLFNPDQTYIADDGTTVNEAFIKANAVVGDHTHVEADIIDLDKYTQQEVDDLLFVKQYYNTGLVAFGQIEVINLSADTTFNIKAGFAGFNSWDGDINTASTVEARLKTFGPYNNIIPQYLAVAPATYIGIEYDFDTDTLTVVQKSSPFTPTERRRIAVLGSVIHTNNININNVNNIAAPLFNTTNQVHDFMEAVGALNVSGNLYLPVETTLQLRKTAGTIFKLGANMLNNWADPHNLNISSREPININYRLSDSTAEIRFTVDPNNYETNNVKTAVPNNKWTVQRISMFQSGETAIQYGQQVYDNKEDAENAIGTEIYNVEQNINDNGIFRAYLVIKQGTINLSNTDNCKILNVNKFGATIAGGTSGFTYNDIVDGLGYVPENVVNKAINFNTINNTLYPTTEAVYNLFNNIDLSDYQLLSEKGQANGYVPLDSSTKIPQQYLPTLSIADTFVVNSQAEMLALAADQGDVAIRLDEDKSYILASNDPTVLADWIEIITPNAVTSVNSLTGNVLLNLTYNSGLLGITNGNTINLDNYYSQLNHASTHLEGGSDEIAGEDLSISLSSGPVNYTPTDTNLEGHLLGIDAALANVSTSTPTLQEVLDEGDIATMTAGNGDTATIDFGMDDGNIGFTVNGSGGFPSTAFLYSTGIMQQYRASNTAPYTFSSITLDDTSGLKLSASNGFVGTGTQLLFHTPISTNENQIFIPALSTTGGSYTIPLSINGEVADSEGNITIPVGSLQDLQSVLNEGTDSILTSGNYTSYNQLRANSSLSLVEFDNGTNYYGSSYQISNNSIKFESIDYNTGQSSNLGIYRTHTLLEGSVTGIDRTSWYFGPTGYINNFTSPNPGVDGDYILPITVNGVSADSEGNITLATGGTDLEIYSESGTLEGFDGVGIIGSFDFNTLTGTGIGYMQNIQGLSSNILKSSGISIILEESAYSLSSPIIAIQNLGTSSTFQAGVDTYEFRRNNYTGVPATSFIVDAIDIAFVGAVRIADSYTLPSVDGTANQVLSTNGSGVVSWVDMSGGSGINPTGLEAIDEGNGIGWRLIGRDPDYYGNIGEGAVDFGRNNSLNTTLGAVGTATVNIGEDNLNNGWGSLTVGYNITNNGYVNITSGQELVNNTYATLVTGYGNESNGSNSKGYNFITGRDNKLTGSYGVSLIGTALVKSDSLGTVVLGTANEDVTSSNNTSSTNPIIIIGNGTHGTSSGGDWGDSATRSNLLVGLRNGEITLPSTTVSVINSESTGRQLVTREWVQAQGYLTDGGSGAVDGVVTNVQLTGSNLVFTGLNGGFNGTVDLSSLGGGSSANDYLIGGSFNNNNGNLTLEVSNQSDIIVNLDGRYLTTESDPIFTSSPAYNITNTLISNWTTAYNNNVVSGVVTGDSTKSLVLTLRNGSTLSPITWTDNTGTGGTGLTQEQVEDYVGAMVSGNTESSQISVTYSDNGTGAGKLNFILDDDLSNYDNSVSNFASLPSDPNTDSLLLWDDSASDLAWVQSIPDSFITSSSITQHEGDLTIDASQITNLNTEDPFAVTGISVTGTTTKTIVLTRRNGSTLTDSFTDLNGSGGGTADGNDYLINATFNTGNGVLSLDVQNQSLVTVDLDGRYSTLTMEQVQDNLANSFIQLHSNGLLSTTYNDSGNTLTFEVVDDLSQYSNVNSQFISSGDNISELTNDVGYITQTLTTEQVQDIVGGMVSGNTENNISVTYNDSSGKLNFDVTGLDLSNYVTRTGAVQDITSRKVFMPSDGGKTSFQGYNALIAMYTTNENSVGGIDVGYLGGDSDAGRWRYNTGTHQWQLMANAQSIALFDTTDINFSRELRMDTGRYIYSDRFVTTGGTSSQVVLGTGVLGNLKTVGGQTILGGGDIPFPTLPTYYLRKDVNDTKTGGYLRMNNSLELQFGNSNGMNIFHNGSHSYCDMITGDFIFRNNTTEQMRFVRTTGEIQAKEFRLTSDRNYKENIEPLDVKPVPLNYVTYNMKGSSNKRVGVIAQEVEETNPEFVNTNEDGRKTINAIDLLMAKIAELEHRIKELEK